MVRSFGFILVVLGLSFNCALASGSEANEALVKATIKEILGRSATARDIAYWQPQLDTGSLVEAQLRQMIMASDEAFVLETFIQNLLRRPTVAELRKWNYSLQTQDVSRASFVTLIQKSREYSHIQYYLKEGMNKAVSRARSTVDAIANPQIYESSEIQTLRKVSATERAFALGYYSVLIPSFNNPIDGIVTDVIIAPIEVIGYRDPCAPFDSCSDQVMFNESQAENTSSGRTGLMVALGGIILTPEMKAVSDKIVAILKITDPNARNAALAALARTLPAGPLQNMVMQTLMRYVSPGVAAQLLRGAANPLVLSVMAVGSLGYVAGSWLNTLIPTGSLDPFISNVEGLAKGLSAPRRIEDCRAARTLIGA